MLEKITDIIFQPQRKKIGDFEKKIIIEQMNIYKIGGREDEKYLYDYRKAYLSPSYETQVLDPFIQKIKLNNDKPCVLDLGSGTGETSDFIETNGIRTIKADISHSGLKGQNDAVQLSAWRLPFPDDAFDGIHSKDMITHIPPQFREKLFSELSRIIKLEGTLLLCSVNETLEGLSQYPTSRKELIKRAKKNGFTLENTKTWQPEVGDKDWYSTKRPRFVLELKKHKPSPNLKLLNFLSYPIFSKDRQSVP